jgi:addiction module RelE/StbE family toxin
VNIVWTPEAERDRLAIWTYLVAEDPAAAVRMDALFSTAVARLADFPLLGKAGVIAGTRELVPHPSYRLVYEVVGETVWILVLIHTARLWPPVWT